MSLAGYRRTWRSPSYAGFDLRGQGEPVAGLVASAMGDTAIYLLGATSDKGLNSKGAYLLHGP